MSVRTVVQGSGTSDLINQGLHAGVKVDTDDGKLKYKDNGGTVRTVVRTSDSNPFAAVDGAMQYAEVAISSAEMRS